MIGSRKSTWPVASCVAAWAVRLIRSLVSINRRLPGWRAARDGQRSFEAGWAPACSGRSRWCPRPRPAGDQGACWIGPGGGLSSGSPSGALDDRCRRVLLHWKEAGSYFHAGMRHCREPAPWRVDGRATEADRNQLLSRTSRRRCEAAGNQPHERVDRRQTEAGNSRPCSGLGRPIGRSFGGLLPGFPGGQLSQG
jgi:hypothetical protein